MNLFFAISKETLLRAGQNSILGIVIVFAVLLLICFLIGILRYFGSAPQKEEVQEQAVEQTQTQVQTVSQETDDLELIAVITAAIHAYEQEQGVEIPVDALIVRSIKKINKTRWQKA